MRIFRFFYGWTIAATILISWGISIGPRQSFSIFLLPFVGEFGSSRSATAAAFSIHMTFYALGGWVLGILMDRVGPRRIIAWSTAGWALILVLCSQLHSVWQLYLVYGVLGGVATGGLSYVTNNAILARWFVRYRGLASGIAQAGVPLGAAVYGPLAQLGVTGLGWRTTHIVFGIQVGVCINLLVRNRTGQSGKPEIENFRDPIHLIRVAISIFALTKEKLLDCLKRNSTIWSI